MKKYKNLIVIGFLIFSLFLTFPISRGRAKDILYSNESITIPTIDGIYDDPSEWDDANETSFFHTPDPSTGHRPGYIHLYFKNTNGKLFILIDDIPDNTSETDDFVRIMFDCNYDGIIDENLSMKLSRDKSFDLIGNSLADWGMGFRDSVNNDTEHSILEISIDITMNSEYDGSSTPEELGDKLPVGTSNNSIRIAMTVVASFCDWDYPQGFVFSDPTTYAILSLEEISNGNAIPFSDLGVITAITFTTIIGIILVIMKRKEI